MFNRIFKNKDSNASKSLPPGHRASHTGSSGSDGAGGAAPAEPMGGGFFNLPPTLKGPPSYASPGQSMGSGPPPGPAPAQGGFSRPSSAGQHHSVPSYGAPQPPAPSASSYGAPAPASDMFGGMSLKAPPAQPPRPSPVKYGGGSGAGYGGTASHAYEPQAAAPMPALFSGLDVVPASAAAAASPAPYSAESDFSRPGVKRSGGISGRSGSVHSVGSAGGGAEPVAQQRQSIGPGIGGSSASITRASGVAKTVKKKKTKSFRPGFGRQLSDESIAALQRGDLNEEDVMQQLPAASAAAADDHHHDNAPPRMATNATDLAHLLPPVKNSGSLLAGLTTHGAAAAASTSTSASASVSASSSGGSILSGLTVHGGSAPSPRASSPPSETRGSVLAGLSVHSTTGSSSSSEPPDASSISVVLPSSKKKTNTPPPEPEKPAAPPTPEEKLMNTLRDFHASAVNFRNSAMKQNEEENRILERKIQLAKQLTQYEIDLRTIEAQQQQAVEVEDFEKADALNATINSVRHCITLSESDVRKVDSELTAFVKAKEKAFTNQLRSTRGTLKDLEKFRDDQDTERNALRDELKQYEVEQSEHLQFEAERIDTELHHVASNMDHITSERAEIETTIEEQCKNEISLREELLVQKAGVQEEIRELERQLRLKMEQMQGIQSSIDKAEKEIHTVRSRYSRQLKRISDREDGLLKTKREVEADAEQLKDKKKEFTDTIQDFEVRIAAFGKRMAAVKKEMRAAMLLASVLEVQETRREQAIVRKKQHTAELTALADSAAIAEQSFSMLRKQHDDLEKSLGIHRNAIASAEAMIPKLEHEKKAAAAQRNFKEAARISKDIKALEKDQATAEEMVEVVEMELQDLKERIAKRETEYEEKKQELKTVEKQLELNTLQELWKEAKHLRKSLRKFEKIKSDGIAASDGVDFRASALLLVQAEYDACIMQAEALEEKYEVADPNHDDESDEASDDESVGEDEGERRTEAAGFGGRDAEVAAGASQENGDANDLSGADGPAALEELASKIEELEEMIEKATENEEYELAAKLDDKIETLRRRHQSLHAIGASVAAESSASVAESAAAAASNGQVAADHEDHGYEQQHDEDEHDEEEEESNTPEELENELRLLRARIKMLEADIERATENEEYETAAELEDEMQQLRDEEVEILELLAEDESHSAARASHAAHPVPAAELPSASLFEGLGFKTATGAEKTPAPVASETVNMFAGLQLGTSSQEDEHEEDEAHADAVAVKEDSPSPKHEATAAVSPKEAPSSPRRVAVGSGPNSPRRKSSLGMFSGLQVGSSPAEESPRKPSLSGSSPEQQEEESTTTAMFEGLQLGTTTSHAESSSPSASTMFDGLLVGSSVEATTVETAVSSALFGGLALTTSDAVAVVETEETTSDDGVVVDKSDATEPSSEDSLSVVGGLSVKSVAVAEEASSVDATTTTTTTTFTTTSTSVKAVVTQVETETETETTSTTGRTTADLFGGLSFAGSEPVAAADAPAKQD